MGINGNYSKKYMSKTEEEIKLELEKSTNERVKKCQEEIATSLKKHKCEFDVSVVLKLGQVIPQISIRSL